VKCGLDAIARRMGYTLFFPVWCDRDIGSIEFVKVLYGEKSHLIFPVSPKTPFPLVHHNWQIRFRSLFCDASGGI